MQVLGAPYMVADSIVHPERIAGRKVAVLGLARTGRAACEMLLGCGAQVLASDRGRESALQAEAERLRDLGAWVELGGHSVEALLEADFIVPSPGLSAEHEVLQLARRRGVPVFSEIEVAFWICRAPVLAVTGTNGKTTTATLLHRMLKTGGYDARLAGNVGLPFAAVAAEVSGPVVLEVSSYQLEYTETFRPRVAALLNVTPDHLERHGTLDAYAEAKYRIAENQQAGDTVVLNADDERARDLPVSPGVRALFFSTHQFLPEGVFCDAGRLVYRRAGARADLIPLKELRVPGVHNQANAAAAAAMALAFGVSPDAVGEALRSFAGVPHRIEDLGTRAGRRFYNDSKATNVGAMCVALAALPGPLVLLVGGRHKGDDPHGADALIRDRVRSIIAFGEARERFAAAWGALQPVTVVDDLATAVHTAWAASRPGDTILLSPACASFDQFQNFEERGEKFREYVGRITE